jgi:hypothetical protein
MSNLNTNAEVRDEGNWSYDGWSPRIGTDAAMDSFVGGLVTRANAQLRQRVGIAWYNANIASDPWTTLLKAAEMHLAQAFLLEAAAQIAETGSDLNPAPFLGDADTIRSAAQRRREDFEAIVALTRSASRPGGELPYAAMRSTSAAIAPRFDPKKGERSA